MDNLSTNNISFKLVVIYIPEQNSYSKKKGGVFIIKVCIICIIIHLFQQLWPKVIKIIKYIANHTPMKKHEWKILYELIKKYFPNFAHLKIYKCKAYNKINMLPKK